MATKLCQITALLTGKKDSTQRAITDVYHRLQKPPLFVGHTKRYVPKDEDGEKFPEDKQVVQFKVKDCLTEIRAAMTTLWDLTATQDNTNCVAKGDVVVDGRKVLEQVPVGQLLFLEKQLIDLQTELRHIPTLDQQEEWAYDANVGFYKSDMAWQHKTKKVPRNHVKAEATKEHPAQVEMYYEDVPIGKFETVKFSGAMPADEKTALLQRIGKLRDAVKMAREEANTVEVKDMKIGDRIFDFVFGK
jgi:hypothetical protein